jgi:hypothetical protein
MNRCEQAAEPYISGKNTTYSSLRVRCEFIHRSVALIIVLLERLPVGPEQVPRLFFSIS